MSLMHALPRLCLLVLALATLQAPTHAQNRKGQIESDKFWADASRGLEWISSSKVIPSAATPSALDIVPDSANSRYTGMVDTAFDPDVHRVVILAQGRKVLHRKYNPAWVDETSRPISFSMAKSLVGLAVGKALCAGAIQSLDDSVQRYSSRLMGTSWGQAKIRHVLAMMSGSNKPAQTPTGSPTPEVQAETLAKAYNGPITHDFVGLMKKADAHHAASGQVAYYNNLDTQALALLVEDATGQKFVDFFTQEIWAPSGASQSAKWFHNTQGEVVAFSGFTGHPYDWIRLANYVMEARDADTCFGKYLREATRRQSGIKLPNGEVSGYGFQMWVGCAGTDAFCFIGHGGQRVLMHPGTRAVMYMHSSSLVGSQTMLPVFREFVQRLR